MNKIVSITAILCVAALLLSACGSPAAEPQSGRTQAPAAESGEAVSETAEPAPEEAVQETPAEPAAPGGAAYAWLGMQDMPRCHYIDAVASAHYYREFVYISTGNVYSETVEAVDGVNIYYGTQYTRSYTIDGRSIGFNDSAMVYSEREDNSSAAEAAEALAQAVAAGENVSGRAFAEAGRGPVPAGYDYFFDDVSDYDYYEFHYPATEEYGLRKIERYYMRNGDVFAIYFEESFGEEILSDYTEVIRSITTEIPEGVFDLPDLDGYQNN